MTTPPPTVILLHGLTRRARCMKRIENALRQQGFATLNIDYPSRHHDIPKLVENFILPKIRDHISSKETPLHFVTHSMGGILVRYLLQHHPIAHLGRIVMLAPPNKGSEWVDLLKNLSLFRYIYGPAGQQLSTNHTSIPNILPALEAEIGVITGNRNLNPLANWVFKGPHDSRVSVTSAQLTGMKEFLVVPCHHSFIMYNQQVIKHIVQFLVFGSFHRQDS